MPFRPRFWEDGFWVNLGERLWGLFELARATLELVEGDDSEPYVRAAAVVSKRLVELIGEKFELEEPVLGEFTGARLVTEYMRLLASFSIGRDEAVTLAWTTRFITAEYALASYEFFKEKPENLDRWIALTGAEVFYEPPALFRGGEIDLTIYHYPGYLEDPVIEPRAEHAGEGKFRYRVRITEKPGGRESIGGLLAKIGLVAWATLHDMPGILSVFRATDARTIYLERAGTRIPSEAAELYDTMGMASLGDGKPYYFTGEGVDRDGRVWLEYASEPEKLGFPVPRKCSNSVYEIKGALVIRERLCLETNLSLTKTSYTIEATELQRLNVLEALRCLSPYIFLGLIDVVKLGGKKIMLVSRT